MKSAEAGAAPTKKSFTYNLYRGRLFRLLKSSSTNSRKVAAILEKFPELVNEKDRNGDTPLHLALMQSKGEPNKSVAAILDHATAENLRTKNKRDLTPTNLVIAYKLMSPEVTITEADKVAAIDVNPQLLNFKDRNKKSLFADDLKRNKGFTDKDIYHAYKAKGMLEAGKYTELGEFLSQLSPKGEALKFLEFVDSKGEKLFAKELEQNKGFIADNIAYGYELIASINRGESSVIGTLNSIPKLANFQDRDGNTFAHHAIMSEHLPADKVLGFLTDLQKKGVDLNKQNAKGETILHTLAKSGKYSQELFDKICNELGANPAVMNKEGKSAAALKTDRNVEIANSQSHEAAKASGKRFAYHAEKTKEQRQGGPKPTAIRTRQKSSSTASMSRTPSGKALAPAEKGKKTSISRKLKNLLGLSSTEGTAVITPAQNYVSPPEHNRQGEIGYRSKSGDTRIL